MQATQELPLENLALITRGNFATGPHRTHFIFVSFFFFFKDTFYIRPLFQDWQT